MCRKSDVCTCLGTLWDKYISSEKDSVHGFLEPRCRISTSGCSEMDQKARFRGEEFQIIFTLYNNKCFIFQPHKSSKIRKSGNIKHLNICSIYIFDIFSSSGCWIKSNEPIFWTFYHKNGSNCGFWKLCYGRIFSWYMVCFKGRSG